MGCALNTDHQLYFIVHLINMTWRLFFILAILFSIVALTLGQHCPYQGFRTKHLTMREMTRQGREKAITAALRVTKHKRRDANKINQNTVFVVDPPGRYMDGDDRTWFDSINNRCCFKSDIEFRQFNCQKNENNKWTCSEENESTSFKCHHSTQNGHFEFT